MAGGGGGGGGGRVSEKLRATIQSIKEVVGGHSDAEIYAALKESNMDPNETAQKLLNQDPFHEVKRKRDKKRENVVQKSSADTREQVEQNSQWMKPHAQWIRNDQRRAYNHNLSSDAGPSREFRIVRDNRFGQGDSRTEPASRSSSGSVQIVDKSVAVVHSDQKNFLSTSSEGYHMPQGANNNSNSELKPNREVQGGLRKYSKPYSSNSLNGSHFSTYDPVHVPPKAAGTVGTIRRQIGVVSVPRQPSAQSGSQQHGLSSSFHQNMQRGNSTSVGPSGRHYALMSKSIQFDQRPPLDVTLHGRSIGRSSFVAQNISKYHQASASSQKAMQRNKEWKPKSVKNASTNDLDDSRTSAVSPSANKSGNSENMDVTSLSEKISHANMLETEHVIIPEHLRVPESEQTKLRFGSFTSGFDSNHAPALASPESENPEHVSESVQLVSSEDTLGAEDNEVDEQVRSLQHDLPTSAAEISVPPSEESEHMNGQEMENDDGLGLVQSDAPLVSAADARNVQSTSSLPTFSAYGPEDHEANNGVQFYRLVEPHIHPQVVPSTSEAYHSENPEANSDVQVFRMAGPTVHSQVLPPTSEALSSQLASSSPLVVSTQQQQLAQPQPAAQLYPQVHMSHFPNFMPYRHVYSPVYVPPMAMPNYSTNIPYPHPSSGNNYLQMPGGSSHLTAGGMKYGVSQYKSVPAGNPSGYGNYTHPAGFTISSPGVIGGAVGLDDVNRIKYKDNNLYVSTPQVETSDLWIQTPREIQTLQSSPYYNLTGQAAPAAFVPNAGNASFNATAQSSHAQFPGLYHPQQPPSIVSPHHMVHQQVPPAIGGNVGVGVAAPPAQVGAYQQPQLGHLNWRANF